MHVFAKKNCLVITSFLGLLNSEVPYAITNGCGSQLATPPYPSKHPGLEQLLIGECDPPTDIHATIPQQTLCTLVGVTFPQLATPPYPTLTPANTLALNSCSLVGVTLPQSSRSRSHSSHVTGGCLGPSSGRGGSFPCKRRREEN